jgi:single-strand DNA-binding protein
VVCTSRVATNLRQGDTAGEMLEETEWTVVEVWGRQAELCGRYLAKGSLMGIEGQPYTRSCEDRENGQRRSDTDIRAIDVMFLEYPEHDGTTSVRACVIEDLPFTW